jgi:hypothetical protein
MFKLPPQIVRVILLTVFIVGSYLTARAFLTPHSFGKYGWYRADALEEIASRPRHYAGQKACDECHSDEVVKVAKFDHKTVSCESCHGALLNHAEDPDHTTVAKHDDSHCLRCHLSNVGRPAFLKQITPEKHYTGQACKECHAPHQPTEVP